MFEGTANIDYPTVVYKSHRNWRNDALPGECFHKRAAVLKTVKPPQMKLQPCPKQFGEKKCYNCGVNRDYIPDNAYQGYNEVLDQNSRMMTWRLDQPYMQNLVPCRGTTFDYQLPIKDKKGNWRLESYDELNNDIKHPLLEWDQITPERLGADPGWAIEQYYNGGRFFMNDRLTAQALQRSRMRRDHKMGDYARTRQLYQDLWSDPYGYKEREDQYAYDYSDIPSFP